MCSVKYEVVFVSASKSCFFFFFTKRDFCGFMTCRMKFVFSPDILNSLEIDRSLFSALI